MTHKRVFVRNSTMTHWLAQPSLAKWLALTRLVRLTEGVVPRLQLPAAAAAHKKVGWLCNRGQPSGRQSERPLALKALTCIR